MWHNCIGQGQNPQNVKSKVPFNNRKRKGVGKDGAKDFRGRISGELAVDDRRCRFRRLGFRHGWLIEDFSTTGRILFKLVRIDVFQLWTWNMEAKVLTPGAGSSDFESSNKPHEITQPASKDHENGVSIDNSHKSEENEDGSSDHALIPPVSGVTCESLAHSMSPKQSPPLQVMERAGGYDPLRIPSSIFEKNKGAQPMDWSVASNESLFSIHVGNNSFSRDHALLFGDPGKSGDITKSGESIMFSPLPPREMVATDNRSSFPDMETNKQKGGSSGMADNTIKDPAEYQNEEDNTNQAVSWKSPSSSNRSYGSGDSVKSFSFPILANGMRSGSLKAGVEQQQKQQHLEPHPAPSE
ncbi:hypothetical protein OIU78_005152 [Salix suchowensis]|nr:hypothetical protein OIU78_005152 [Salix suchowensis]